MKKIVLILCLIVTLVAISSCKPEVSSSDKWECHLEQFSTTITLIVDYRTNLVSVSKSPKKKKQNEFCYQFREGQQYLLENDTLHLINPPDDSVFCAFEITRLSDNEMELKYLGEQFWPDACQIKSYLFYKK